MSAKKFYITAAIPYVNAKPHIGHALEFVQSDTVARYKKMQNYDVLFLSGGDENALKNVQAAEKAKIPVEKFVKQNSEFFEKLAADLNIGFDIFQRGSDQKKHFHSSQELWRRCLKNGDIYKKEYRGLYCVGCEAFYEKSELNEKGECFEHPGKKLSEVAEENYFFKLSKYQEQLVKIIAEDIIRIIPEFRKNEIMAFLDKPLHDISISRSNERARNWGVPVPDDPGQRIYVWFDALNIYQSGVGFGWDKEMYKKYWPADVHVIGKGIARFHAVYWPAFLLSAKLDLPKTIFIHGYITVEGQKMSKTVGNVVDPNILREKYGVDALRYYLLREIPPYDDGDFSRTRMKEIYDSDLANELGNLVSRLTNLAEKDKLTVNSKTMEQFNNETTELFEKFKFNKILENIWLEIKALNKSIDDFAPWNRTAEERKDFLIRSVNRLGQIGFQLQPFIPDTASAIIKSTRGKIKKVQPIFPRI